MRLLFQVFLLASFAMWFGGFGFYASFVVPVGNATLGSFEQATVTRQVTVPLNWLGVLAGCLMLLDSISLFDSISSWKTKTKLAMRVQFWAALFMLLMQATLFWLHPQIDAYVDLEVREVVGDYDQFYWLHRVYLWTITLQWVASWLWLFAYVASKRPLDKPFSKQ